MQVFNAKRGTITFMLGTGMMTIQPGECSDPFVGDAAILRTILTLGEPSEIGIIINSPYEYDALNEVSAAQAYMFRSIEDAKAKLIDGRPPMEVNEGPNDIEYQKLKNEIAEKDKTINELTDALKQAKEDLANAPIEKYKSELDNVRKENAQQLTRIQELEDILKNSKADESDLKLRFESLQKEHEGLKQANQDLQNALESAKENEGASAELKKKLEETEAELAKVKEDGAKLFERYNGMKEAMRNLCDTAGYTMVDGQWVKKG